MTTDLSRRIFQHRYGDYFGFTKKYYLTRLVYVEVTVDFETCRNRERQMKEWQRDWKIRIVEKVNPRWEDLGDRYL